MKLFIHGHFTGLRKDDDLISIAIVAENGKYFYAESTEYDMSKADSWIKENVISNLKFNHIKDSIITIEDTDDKIKSVDLKGNKHGIRNMFNMWIEQFGDVNIEWWADVNHYTFVQLIDLLFISGLSIPKKYSLFCNCLCQKLAETYHIKDATAFDINRKELLAKNDVTILGNRFNALYDAMTVKAIYDRMEKGELVL